MYLPVPFILLWIHSLHTLWKRLGWVSYLLHGPFFIGMMIAIVRFRHIWPAEAWNWPIAVSVAAIVPFLFAVWLATLTHQKMDLQTILMIPQISQREWRTFISKGVYARIRHPRYAMFILLSLSNFLLTGYPLVLASLAVIALSMILIIHLEEKELIAHFGELYEQYRKEVPAMIPRKTSRSGKILRQ